MGGMIEHEVTRTLVKSQPEVWAQCSEADSLGRHLNGSFGEIRITRLEPEHSVAWEGEEVSGTVRIEPSAWGTRVTMTVEVAEEEPGPQLEAVVAEEPPEEPVAALEPEALVESPEPTGPPRVTFLAKLRARFRRSPEDRTPVEEVEEPVMEAPEVEPAVAVNEPVQETPEEEAQMPVPPPEDRPDTTAALNAALESLGQAHHRPFSRA